MKTIKFIFILIFTLIYFSVSSQNNLKHNFIPDSTSFIVTMNGTIINDLDKAYYHYKAVDVKDKWDNLEKVIHTYVYNGKKIYMDKLNYAVLNCDTTYYVNDFKYSIIKCDTIYYHKKRKESLFNKLHKDSNILYLDRYYSDNTNIHLNPGKIEDLHVKIKNDENILRIIIDTDKYVKFDLNIYGKFAENFYKSEVDLYNDTQLKIDISYLEPGEYKVNITDGKIYKWFTFNKK